VSITGSAPPRGRPAPDDRPLARYWRAELADFEAFRASTPDGGFPDWRPASWQSAGRVVGDVLSRCSNAVGQMPRTATELGCGAAGILLQLASHGLVTMGVDREPAAMELAARATSTVRPFRDPSWCLDDFLRPGFAEIVPPADIVASAGVLERYDAAAQAEVLRIHAALSNRWVLVCTANVRSPLYRSQQGWAARTDRSHCDNAADVDLPALVAAAGHRVVASDGYHVFLDRPEWYLTGDPELDELCDRLRDLLVARGGRRYAAFPHLELTTADLPVMEEVESGLGRDERMRLAYRRYHLVELGAPDARP
jgi:hypothetical protein